jgi:hypothetical protein
MARPTPGAIINVATEDDICHTVCLHPLLTLCNRLSRQSTKSNGQRSTEFHSWLNRAAMGSPPLSTLTPSGIIINLRALSQVSIDLPSGTATLAAGVLTREVLSAAQEADAHIVTGVCNTVGVIPALLGGGLGNLNPLRAGC